MTDHQPSSRLRKVSAFLGAIFLLAVGAALGVVVLQDEKLPFRPPPTHTPAPEYTPRPDGKLPALGTNATTAEALDATLKHMGRSKGAWNTSYMQYTDPVNAAFLDAEAARGVTHHIITLEFLGIKVPRVLNFIHERNVDGHLRRIAQQLARWDKAHPGHEIILRPFHEANGNWYPWSFGKNNLSKNALEDFKPVWYRTHDIMQKEFPGLKFFWCPNILQGKEKSFKDWYPGPNTTDYVGVDGYNQNGGIFEDDKWRTPDQVLLPSVKAIRQVAPDKPLIIGETGTSEPSTQSVKDGRSKAEWFRQFGKWAHEVAPMYGVVAISYFDYDKTPESGNDWRIYPTHKTGDKSGKPKSEALESRQAFRDATAGLP